MGKQNTFEYEENNQKSYNRNNILLVCSIGLWFISLLLVGFYVGESAWVGWNILMLMPLAWIAAPAGLAVYANIFYWFVILSLLRNKEPKISLNLMVILALLTLTLREVPKNEAGHMSSVDIWGYGAFVWGFALILLIGAVKDRRQNCSVLKILLPYFSVFLAIISATLIYKNHQWKQANIYEKDYLSRPHVAFAVFKLSGIHYASQPFPKTLPNLHLPLEVEGEVILQKLFSTEPLLKVNHEYFELPNVFIYKGYKITNTFRYFMIEKSNEQAVYRYRIEEIGNNRIRLSLYDIHQQHEIWFSEADLNKKSSIFDTKIQKLFNKPDYIVPKKQPTPKQIRFTTGCSTSVSIPQGINITGRIGKSSYTQIQIDNKLTNLIEHSNTLFCQNNTILEVSMMYVGTGSNHKIPYVLSASLLQRDNLELLAYFKQENLPPELQKLFDKYNDKASKYIQSAELNEHGLLLKHEFGETLLLGEPLLLNQKK